MIFHGDPPIDYYENGDFFLDRANIDRAEIDFGNTLIDSTVYSQ